jgi:hypothetical protein
VRHAQWAVFGMGSVIAGVTVWHAAFGVMPQDLPLVITGTLLAVGHFAWAFVGLEDKKDREQIEN